MVQFTPEKLETFMQMTGMTKSDLAKLCGVSRPTMTYILRGDVRITPKMNKKLNVVYKDMTDLGALMAQIEVIKLTFEGEVTRDNE